jgi:hypothetical protein
MIARANRHISSDRAAIAFIVPGIIGLIAFAFLHTSLDGFWRFDDGAHLDFALTFSPWQYFFEPDIAHAQSGAFIAPWNAFFYEISHSLFGLQVKYYYLHQLILLTLTAFMLYRIASLYSDCLSAVSVSILFLAGIPTFVVANELMTGHYAYGLLFSTVSVYFYARFQSTRLLSSLALSAFCYLLALLCKEIYAPLPLLLFLIAKSPIKDRALSIAPFAFIGAVYLWWRFTVLGEIVGGYSARPKLPLSDVITLGQTLLSLFGDTEDYAWQPMLAAGFIFIGAILVIFRRQLPPSIFLASLFISLMPLVLLLRSSPLEEVNRYFFLVWAFLSVLAGFIVSRLRLNLLARSFLIVAIVWWVAAYTDSLKHRYLIENALFFDTFYKAIYELAANQYILVPNDRETDYLVYVGNRFAKVLSEQRDTDYRNDFFITSSARLLKIISEGKTVLALDQSSRHFVPTSGQPLLRGAKKLDEERMKVLSARRLKSMPLSVTLSFGGDVVRWSFGPYTTGKYRYFMDSAPTGRAIRRSGSYPLKARRLTIQVLYDSTEGWSALSPEITIDPERMARAHWEGIGMSAGSDTR